MTLLPNLASPQWLVAAVVLLTIGFVILALAYAFRDRIPVHWQVPLRALLFRVRVDHAAWITMPDGVRLAGSLYLPRFAREPLATVYISLPYDRRHYDEALGSALSFARHGYAVLLQDVRSKFESEGKDFLPWRHATADGAATLDWIVSQPWSNGKVGTFGSSALGELQYSLARARHPAHAAMIPIAAGGAIGSAAQHHGCFGSYEGGIFQLASGFGWFAMHGAKDPQAPPHGELEPAITLLGLPVADLVRRVRPDANAYDDYVHMTPGDPAWENLDFVSDSDRIATPALVVDTWGDQGVAGTLALAEFVRTRAPADAPVHQHVLIAPGNHCEHEQTARSGRFGDLVVRNAQQPWFDMYLRWFDYWLRGQGDGLATLPAYSWFVVGEDRWLSSRTWPPEQARSQHWHLGSGGHANTRDGDGVLALQPFSGEHSDEFVYDPEHPVPSRGGPVCCTGDPSSRSGPVDQADVETRDDVLVYTSPPLQQPLRIAGPLRARLMVSSSAPDTDFVARLVHVRPDGRATNIQEGALRARYRNGLTRPELMQQGQTYALDVDMRSIAYLVPRGHRIRLDVTSSCFPRLERNLNTGGVNVDEATPVKARNRLHHGGAAVSYLALSVLDTPAPQAGAD